MTGTRTRGSPPGGEVTTLLLRWTAGDETALPQLVPLVYAELRRIAARQLHHEAPEHALDPTALVHEVYLRLVDQQRATWVNRRQFFAVAAGLMRRVVVDHARARHAEKRGGCAVRVSLEEADRGEGPAVRGAAATDVLAVNAALDRLAEVDPAQARLVELRFFAGLSVEEIAAVLHRSPRTVKREWRLAKAWLLCELG